MRPKFSFLYHTQNTMYEGNGDGVSRVIAQHYAVGVLFIYRDRKAGQISWQDK